MSNYNFFRQHRPMFEETPEENQGQQPQTYWQPEPREPENYDYEEDNDGDIEEEIEKETEPDWEEEIEEEVEDKMREETEHGYEEDFRSTEDVHGYSSPIQPSFPPLRKLRRIRLEEKCTQKRCADYLGVSMQYYSQIERGINTLSYPNALKLALFFNTTTDELFKEDYADYDETMQIMMQR